MKEVEGIQRKQVDKTVGPLSLLLPQVESLTEAGRVVGSMLNGSFLGRFSRFEAMES